MSDTRIFNSEEEYEALLLENAARAIKTHRGAFYPLGSYGSGLYAVTQEPFETHALAQARRALYGQSGIYPVSAVKTQNDYKFTVLLNGEERQVRILIE